MAPTEGTFLVHKEDSLLHTFMWLAGCLVVLSVDLNFALVSSFLPQEAMRRGVSSTWVGVIVASMSAGNVLAAPFAAKAVDRYGLLLVLTTALSAYSGLLVMMVIPSYQFTAVGFISTCLPLRLLQGVASSFAEVAATVLVFRSIAPQHIARAMGWLEASRAIGQLLGPALGGGLYMALNKDSGHGFWLPFVVCALVLFFAMVAVARMLSDSTSLRPPLKRSQPTDIARILAIFPATAALCCQLMYVMSVTSLEPILAPYLSKPPFNLLPYELGLISGTNTLCFIVFVGGAAVSVGWLGTLTQAVLGQLMIALALTLIGPAPYLDWLPQELAITWGALIIAGAGNALAIVTSAPIISYALQSYGLDREQATNGIAAVLQQAAGLGAILGNILGGAMGDWIGFRSTTAVIGAFYLLVPPSLILLVHMKMFARSASESSTPSTSSRDVEQNIENENSLFATPWAKADELSVQQGSPTHREPQ